MGPLDTLWHLLNFFAPALGIAVLAAAMAKLLWRRRLRGVAWRSLSLWTGAGAAGALLAGLLVFGRDGRIASYGLAELFRAVGLWWAAFGRGR